MMWSLVTFTRLWAWNGEHWWIRWLYNFGCNNKEHNAMVNRSIYSIYRIGSSKGKNKKKSHQGDRWGRRALNELQREMRGCLCSPEYTGHTATQSSQYTALSQQPHQYKKCRWSSPLPIHWPPAQHCSSAPHRQTCYQGCSPEGIPSCILDSELVDPLKKMNLLTFLFYLYMKTVFDINWWILFLK